MCVCEIRIFALEHIFEVHESHHGQYYCEIIHIVRIHWGFVLRIRSIHENNKSKFGLY